MNGQQSKTIPVSTSQRSCWSLEVVRGRATGRLYSLEAGETVLGNALDGQRGLELADQEGGSPRKMAGRHALLTATFQELSVRDLDTPGGTFVNQQRLLAGQARRLVTGDVIQLGGVQVRVKQVGAAGASAPVAAPASAADVRAKLPPPPTKPVGKVTSSPATQGALSSPFSLVGGAQCRAWDDFLVVAAQNWQALRDELISGRLAEYLRRIGRSDLVPLAGSSRSPDDQLDDWLARVPATASSAPELDIHPETLLIKARTGGGITQHTLRITNVGYRLLRSTARVDPPSTAWLRLRPEDDGRQFATIDQTDLPLDVELPETIDRPLNASIVIDSNGGTRRIGVRIERSSEPLVVADSAGVDAAVLPLWREKLGHTLSHVSPVARFAVACAVAVAIRFLSVALDALPIGIGPAGAVGPRLSSLAIMLVAGGMIAGLLLTSRRGELRDFPAALVAGAALGLLTAAFWFALLQSVERLFGPAASSIWVIGLASGLLGASLAAISVVLFPCRSNEPEVAR